MRDLVTSTLVEGRAETIMGQMMSVRPNERKK